MSESEALQGREHVGPDEAYAAGKAAREAGTPTKPPPRSRYAFFWWCGWRSHDIKDDML